MFWYVEIYGPHGLYSLVYVDPYRPYGPYHVCVVWVIYESYGAYNIWNMGNMWTVRCIDPGRKIIYGPYDPRISGRKSIYGPSVRIFLVGSPYIAVLWVSELILRVSELIQYYFAIQHL